MKNCQVLICLEKYKAINPIVSDPAIDGVATNFFVFVGWVSTMTLLRVDFRVASTESFGDFKGLPQPNFQSPYIPYLVYCLAEIMCLLNTAAMWISFICHNRA